MTQESTLRAIFSGALKLPQDAADWLCNLWHVIQFLDDVVDADKRVERYDADRAIMAALLTMPASPFWLRNHSLLMPVMLVALSKWQASDARERVGIINAVSFVWRASYYDVVLMVCHIVHGEAATALAPTVAAMYGETFDDYKKEFEHA